MRGSIQRVPTTNSISNKLCRNTHSLSQCSALSESACWRDTSYHFAMLRDFVPMVKAIVVAVSRRRSGDRLIGGRERFRPDRCVAKRSIYNSMRRMKGINSTAIQMNGTCKIRIIIQSIGAILHATALKSLSHLHFAVK